MGISGISFLVEMDRPFDELSPNTKPFIPIMLRCGDGNSEDWNMYFESFDDLSIDVDGENTVYVEAHDPTDIDENPIEDCPTVSDFKDGKIFSFVARCGDEENKIYPVKITGLTLYQNGYRFDMSDEDCDKLTSALVITNSRGYNSYSMPTPEECLVVEEKDGGRKWVPFVSEKKEDQRMSRDETIEKLSDVCIWDVDPEGENFSKLKVGYIRPGFPLNLGEFYFGNDMYTVEARKSEEGEYTINVDLYRPKKLERSIPPQEILFDFPENDISELVENHLQKEPTTTAVIIPDADNIKNHRELKQSIITELYIQGFVDEKNLPAYEIMQKNRSGFFQQFQRKYDSLENISMHRLSFPKELVTQQKLNPNEVRELGSYYYYLARLTAQPGQTLIERNRETVIEMIKDGLSEQRIGTIFLDINRRMDLGPRNNGVPSILKEPQIKAMLEAQKAVKTRSLER